VSTRSRPVVPSRRLCPGLGCCRSTTSAVCDTMKLLVRRTRTVIGARDFAVSAAAIWNSLTAALRYVFLLGSDICGGNWKLSTPARRCSASENHLFLCALQMHSLLNVLKVTSNDAPSVLNIDPILGVPKCNWCTNVMTVTNVPKITKNDPNVPVFGSVHFYMGFWKSPLLVP